MDFKFETVFGPANAEIKFGGEWLVSLKTENFYFECSFVFCDDSFKGLHDNGLCISKLQEYNLDALCKNTWLSSSDRSQRFLTWSDKEKYGQVVKNFYFEIKSAINEYALKNRKKIDKIILRAKKQHALKMIKITKTEVKLLKNKIKDKEKEIKKYKKLDFHF